MIELSNQEARSIALAAQGLGKRPAKAGLPQVRQAARRLHALQIDTVNVLVRAHYLPLYSRLGPYPVAALDRLTNDTHELVETRVGHQASFVPADLTPLLRWRTEEPSDEWREAWRRALDPGYIAAVERQVVEQGPLALNDLEDPRRRAKQMPHELAIRRRDGQPYAASSLAWGRPSDGKTVLDGLLAEGTLMLAGRRGAERLYDLPERVLPPAVLAAPTPAPADAKRELVRRSATALGVATVADVANYFGLKVTEARAAIRDLVDDGSIRPARVEGWKEPAFLAGPADGPRASEGRALLGPFDSLTWSRDRVRRLFAFEFSFEIYVPEAKRRYGYYVLSFLLDGRLVARVDLKADRRTSTLLVKSTDAEPGVERRAVSGALGEELHDLAAWIGLDHIETEGKGDLVPLRG